MLIEAIQKLVSLAPPSISNGAPGHLLSDKPLSVYDTRPEMPKLVEVSTLSALVDLIGAELNDLDVKNAIVRVQDHSSVFLTARVADEFARRMFHVHVELPKYDGFKFGSFHEQEAFLIGVMANFEDSPDRDYVLNLASKVTSERVITAEDNGVSQQVALKKGAALKTVEIVKQRVKLAPFRTFREISQPVSEFVFRVRQNEEGGVPLLALFEADGGKWKIDAALAVRDWFKGKVGDIPVVA